MSNNTSQLEIINLALDLTAAMKKSYNKSNDDVFNISRLNLLTLNLNSCPSLKHLNLKILVKVLKYLCNDVVRDMMYHHEEITYINVRRVIMMQKQSYHTIMRRNLKQG